MQFWKKDSWPMPQPLITPRPVTTTRFFSAFSCVTAERVLVVVVRSVNASAVEMPITRRGVTSFIFLGWLIICSLWRSRKAIMLTGCTVDVTVVGRVGLLLGCWSCYSG